MKKLLAVATMAFSGNSWAALPEPAWNSLVDQIASKTSVCPPADQQPHPAAPRTAAAVPVPIDPTTRLQNIRDHAFRVYEAVIDIPALQKSGKMRKGQTLPLEAGKDPDRELWDAVLNINDVAYPKGSRFQVWEIQYGKESQGPYILVLIGGGSPKKKSFLETVQLVNTYGNPVSLTHSGPERTGVTLKITFNKGEERRVDRLTLEEFDKILSPVLKPLPSIVANPDDLQLVPLAFRGCAEQGKLVAGMDPFTVDTTIREYIRQKSGIIEEPVPMRWMHRTVDGYWMNTFVYVFQDEDLAKKTALWVDWAIYKKSDNAFELKLYRVKRYAYRDAREQDEQEIPYP